MYLIFLHIYILIFIIDQIIIENEKKKNSFEIII